MADINLDTQSKPATPSAGSGILYLDTVNKELIELDDAGNARVVRPLTNANTADVVATSVDTYLTGSSIAIPPALLRVGALFRWTFAMSKTAAGTATPIWVVRFGTAGTTGDAARLTFTGVAQTAVADNGIATLEVVVRSIGASGVIEGIYFFTHLGAAATQQTGLIVQPTDVKQVTSGAFDTTVASSIIGVSCNPGASGVWTFQHVAVQASNL
jgi:hypothetical protein